MFYGLLLLYQNELSCVDGPVLQSTSQSALVMNSWHVKTGPSECNHPYGKLRQEFTKGVLIESHLPISLQNVKCIMNMAQKSNAQKSALGTDFSHFHII